MSIEDCKRLSELLFPEVKKTLNDLEKEFPLRNIKEGARVTRFAPSPTGFIHMGNLFQAFVSERTAHSTGGIFYIRIEDTDKKREVEGAVEAIHSALSTFEMTVDEGVTNMGEKGSYGPYYQSKRASIYHICAKYLVEQGFAYPCFCTSEELEEIRNKQEAAKLTTGYYGEWAVHRNISLDEAKKLIEQSKPYVLRLRSPGTPEGKVIFDDMIKGKIEMPENDIDHVILKADGIPTYHFAHVVDDHFMRTTHVVRGDEWISSVPLHLQLFKLLCFKPPKYVHISPLMKEENSGKRKLSKRKDPESAVSYYFEKGYPAKSVREYLLTLANSNYEEWRKVNKEASQDAFPFNLKKMSPSGALFDLVKFNDVSKNIISSFSADEVYESVLKWASIYDKEFYGLLAADRNFATGIFSIDRGISKPRKDMAKWSDAKEYTEYFYKTPAQYEWPENISKDDVTAILSAYLKVYNHKDDKENWFLKIKEICDPLGFTPDVKVYKQSPEKFKGHVGDVSTVIRIAVTGRKNTPDLQAIMQLLGEKQVKQRIENVLSDIED